MANETIISEPAVQDAWQRLQTSQLTSQAFSAPDGGSWHRGGAMPKTVSTARARLDFALQKWREATAPAEDPDAHAFAAEVLHYAHTVEYVIQAQQRQIDGLHGRIAEMERRIGLLADRS
ncbi:hypothetical protein N8I74_03625 [Chitiniphilus purpureus]|uniref:Uncharacterized protein n=1 Tax=Chitiniphilus purpureus TaxID=2981137 RepID=A0ABY6DQX4_9NEIS|nr:hypothetical protein [Chitiniphilus sp. CD1]UXY16118.1 hypothetical protein N8I74_03625 [Chitiniphilus sp. CD1]